MNEYVMFNVKMVQSVGNTNNAVKDITSVIEYLYVLIRLTVKHTYPNITFHFIYFPHISANLSIPISEHLDEIYSSFLRHLRIKRG